MPTSMRIVPRGLVTDPSRLVAGDGGLIRAENVVFRSEGLVESRAALSHTANSYALANLAEEVTTLHSREWDSGTVTALSSTDDDSTIMIVSETDPFALITLTGEYEQDKVRIYSELADGRCLWTLPNGLRCLDQSDQGASDDLIGAGAFMRMPGAPRAAVSDIHLVALANSFMAANDTTAYRVTVVRRITDSGGREIPIEGPPSDRYVIKNTLAGSAYVSVSVNVACNVRMGDEIRIYRVPTNGVAGADPGDEMLLRYTAQLTSSTFPVKPESTEFTVTFVDNLSGDEWGGPALYTNASQQGSTRANYRLRSARDLALYQGKLFYGGGDAGYRQSCTVKNIGLVDSDIKDETLLSFKTAGATIDWTIGGTVLSQVPLGAFPYFSVGQLVTRVTGGPYEDPTVVANQLGHIVSFDKGALTVTVDTPLAATVTNADIVAWDWIGIAKESETSTFPEFTVYAPYKESGGTVLIAPKTSNSTGYYGAVIPIEYGGASILAGGIEQVAQFQYKPDTDWTGGDVMRPFLRMYTSTGAVAGRDVSLTIEWDASFGNPVDVESIDGMSVRDCERIAICSSKPRATSMVLATNYDASRVTSNNDSPATLWWSKINQPESVPLGNFAIVGDASQPISRIFATIDRLWILKPDGLYCAYGAGDTEDSITIQLVDSTFRMIDVASDTSEGARCSTWAAKCRDTVFAWTRNGIMAIGSGGPQRIDGPIETDIRAFTPSYNTDQAEQSLGTPFCAASERESLVVFGTSGVAGESPLRSCCYVYHVETGMWATWQAMPLSMEVVPNPGEQSDYIVPERCGGYGASVSGLLRLPAHGGYLSYLDVPANNTARLASTALADDEYPVTGDRTNINTWSNAITAVSGNVVTWDNPGPTLAPGARWTDNDGTWFWTLSTDWTTNPVTSVVTGTPVVGAITSFHFAVPHVVTFSANQPPFSEKHFLSCWAHYQLIRAGTQFDVDWRARGHVEGEAPTLTVVYDDPAGANWPDQRLEYDLEYDKSISIPTAVSRSRGVEMTITQSQADTFFAMDGLTIQYEAETPRIEGRR